MASSAPRTERDRSLVAAGSAARERRNIPTPAALRTRCGRGRLATVPEGRRRKLAGGKSAAQRTPPPETVPNGSVPQRGIEEMARNAGRALATRAARGDEWCRRNCGAGDVKSFSDAPLGHGATRHRFRGRRPLRTCPRLISSGVPPGREPGGRGLPKGNHRRGNGVPNSFGCGSAALCSSRLGGSPALAGLNCYGYGSRWRAPWIATSRPMAASTPQLA